MLLQLMGERLVAILFWGASLVTQMVKNLLAVWETQFSILGPERSTGEGNGYPLQYSCLENPTDSEARWAPVHGGLGELSTTE